MIQKSVFAINLLAQPFFQFRNTYFFRGSETFETLSLQSYPPRLWSTQPGAEPNHPQLSSELPFSGFSFPSAHCHCPAPRARRQFNAVFICRSAESSSPAASERYVVFRLALAQSRTTQQLVLDCSTSCFVSHSSGVVSHSSH